MTIATAPRRKTPFWAKLLLVFFVLLLIAGAGYGGVVLGRVLGANDSRDVQVIRSITREEQVILMTAGVGDIKEERGDNLTVSIPGLEAFSWTVPATERIMFVRYDFDAKLGIEGKDVDIKPDGSGGFRISIPEFRFLGNDDPKLSVASEKNGALSWTTQELDKFKIAEAILDDAMVAKTIDGARPVLEEQARSFYTRIIHAIDPSVKLEFEFAN